MDVYINENNDTEFEDDDEVPVKNFSSFIPVTAFCGCIGGALYMIDITPRQELLSNEQTPLDMNLHEFGHNFNDALADSLQNKKVYGILLNGSCISKKKKKTDK